MATLTIANLPAANALGQKLAKINAALALLAAGNLSLDGIGMTGAGGSIMVPLGVAMPAAIVTGLTNFLTTEQTAVIAALTALGAPTS